MFTSNDYFKLVFFKPIKAKLHFVFSITILLLVFSAQAQHSFWAKANQPAQLQKLDLVSKQFKLDYYTFNVSQLSESIAKNIQQSEQNSIINLPTKDGASLTFKLVKSNLLSADIAANYPEIKFYKGYAINNPNIIVRLSTAPQGLEAMIMYENRSVSFITKAYKGSDVDYVSYYKTASAIKTQFECAAKTTVHSLAHRMQNRSLASNSTLRKFRIAIAATGEYTEFMDDGDPATGNATEDAFREIGKTLNRINAIFETDLGITFVWVADKTIIYSDSTADPFPTTTNASTLADVAQNVFTSEIGEANYDIGHLFHKDRPAGIAVVNSVCINGEKGRAMSAHSFTKTNGFDFARDFFDVDFVPHEIGHQLGAGHTYSHTTSQADLFVEPASGTTIMGYAGIIRLRANTAPESDNNVQLNSDAYFHYSSIVQILDRLSKKSCGTTVPITNNPPIVTAGNDYTIPVGTAYVLTAKGSDPDGDNLTYTWEQIDNGGVVTSNTFGPYNLTGAMARSLPPSSSPARYLPKLESVIKGQLTQTNPTTGSDWETVSNVSRTLNYAVTVRDRNVENGVEQTGQTFADEMVVTVTDKAGPFVVTSQNESNLSYVSGEAVAIKWDVAGTNANGVNTANVDIYLSVDGGKNFNIELATETPNDGAETIVIPQDVAGPYSRFMVKASDNIFYAVNTNYFGVNYTVETTCKAYMQDATIIESAIPANSSTSGATGGPGSDPLVQTLTINEPIVIEELRLELDLEHSSLSDLHIELFHPNGVTSAVVWDQNCGSDDSILAIFSDNGVSINCGSPTTGNFEPHSPFSVFNGLSAQGDWKIIVTDSEPGDVGVLNYWTLNFCQKEETPTIIPPIEDCNHILYPNPNNGIFTIKICDPKLEIIYIDIFDIAGRLIYQRIFKEKYVFEREFSFTHLASGPYIVNINLGYKKISKRIIITN